MKCAGWLFRWTSQTKIERIPRGYVFLERSNSVSLLKDIGEEEGILLEAETGDYLGTHRGFWFYTIGQRQGLRLPGGPWYVVEKDVQHNVVFVSRNYYSLDKRRRTFRVGSLNWFSNSEPANNEQLKCKVRHSPEFHNCTVTQEQTEENEDILAVHLCEDGQGLAACQFAVFYRGNLCLGSGIILDSWDQVSFPVSARALEIARMEDKSQLGKPVRIINLEHVTKTEQEPIQRCHDIIRPL